MESHSDSALAFPAISDQDVSDAYIYLLGRLLITRQQQVDFDKEGFVWNRLVHRKPGQVDWPNPNLDVTYPRRGSRSTNIAACSSPSLKSKAAIIPSSF